MKEKLSVYIIRIFGALLLVWFCWLFYKFYIENSNFINFIESFYENILYFAMYCMPFVVLYYGVLFLTYKKDEFSYVLSDDDMESIKLKAHEHIDFLKENLAKKDKDILVGVVDDDGFDEWLYVWDFKDGILICQSDTDYWEYDNKMPEKIKINIEDIKDWIVYDGDLIYGNFYAIYHYKKAKNLTKDMKKLAYFSKIEF